MVDIHILILASAIGVILWGYGGYVVPILFSTNERKVKETSMLPITVVIPAFNEADIVAEKIKNTLSLNYPKELLKIIVVTDGSTDNSFQVANKFPEVLAIHEPARQGKAMAVNRAMQFVETPWVVFTDANTTLSEESLMKTAYWLSDTNTGGVSGEKKVLNEGMDQVASEGEGVYWKYECFLKQCDSNYHTLIGAPGEYFAMKAEHYQNLEPDTILDDFMLSMRICQKGLIVKYDPEIVASEKPSASTKDELKRKVRISAGAFQSIGRLKPSLNPFHNFKLAYLYWSHRMIRWCIAPVLLPFILVYSLYAWSVSSIVWIEYLVWAQIAFYGLAILAAVLKPLNVKIKGLPIPLYFVLMNYAAVAGFFRYLKNEQGAAWEKVKRA